MTAPAEQLGLGDEPSPPAWPAPDVAIAEWDELAQGHRGLAVEEGNDAVVTIAGLVRRGDGLRDALKAGWLGALRAAQWFLEHGAEDVAQRRLLVKLSRQLGKLMQEWLTEHHAVTVHKAEIEEAFRGTELPRIHRQANDLIGRLVQALPEPGDVALTLDPAAAFDEGVCSSCSKRVLWAKTHLGKPCPLDPEPQLRYVPAGGRTVNLVKTFVTHFITCPFRDDHRKARGTK